MGSVRGLPRGVQARSVMHDLTALERTLLYDLSHAGQLSIDTNARTSIVTLHSLAKRGFASFVPRSRHFIASITPKGRKYLAEYRYLDGAVF